MFSNNAQASTSAGPSQPKRPKSNPLVRTDSTTDILATTEDGKLYSTMRKRVVKKDKPFERTPQELAEAVAKRQAEQIERQHRWAQRRIAAQKAAFAKQVIAQSPVLQYVIDSLRVDFEDEVVSRLEINRDAIELLIDQYNLYTEDTEEEEEEEQDHPLPGPSSQPDAPSPTTLGSFIGGIVSIVLGTSTSSAPRETPAPVYNPKRKRAVDDEGRPVRSCLKRMVEVRGPHGSTMRVAVNAMRKKQLKWANNLASTLFFSVDDTVDEMRPIASTRRFQASKYAGASGSTLFDNDATTSTSHESSTTTTLDAEVVRRAVERMDESLIDCIFEEVAGGERGVLF